MIDMQLGSYHVTSNKFGYQLKKMKMENGEPVTSVDPEGVTRIVESMEGYYPSLEHVLKGMSEMAVRNGDHIATTIDEYRALVHSTLEVIDQTVARKVAEIDGK